MKRIALLLFCAALTLPAQRHKLTYINAGTEEGKLLALVGANDDPARKIQLLEDFATKYPNDKAYLWVLSQLQNAYLTAGNNDKALATGEKLLSLDAGDVEAAYANLKAAEAKKDSEGVLKWARQTSALARKAETAPKGPDESDEDQKYAIESAKKADLYSEYALSMAAFAEQDPKRAMVIVETLQAQNPKSQYLEATLPKYAYAARQANAIPAAVALGSKSLDAGVTNEDLLAIMADYYMNQQKDPDKVITYSDRLVQYLNAKQPPQGVAPADWDKKKNALLGLAYWMQGTTYASQNKLPQADKSLRSALPLIQGNEALMGPALFYLGLANYQTGKGKPQQMSEALKFMQQSAAIKGPYQSRAASNVTAMKQQGAK